MDVRRQLQQILQNRLYWLLRQLQLQNHVLEMMELLQLLQRAVQEFILLAGQQVKRHLLLMA